MLQVTPCNTPSQENNVLSTLKVVTDVCSYRYPAAEKLEIIRLVEQSRLPVRRTLDKLGILPARFYRWYDRYQSGGYEALKDRPPRPKQAWNRIPDDVRGRVLRLALDAPALSPRELATRFIDTAGYFGLCCNFGPATSGWTVFDNDWTGSPIMPSDNPFKWRQFEPGLILLCVRWYLRYAVSYRDLEEMMRERGLCVDHTTIYRWVQRYAPAIDKRCRPFLRRTTDSYRIDETYVRVGGAWHYLYRGVDSNGDTLDFLLRATRDKNAAIAFFRKTVGASHTTPPRVVNVDKNPAYPIAFEAIKHEGFFRPRSSLRQCKYLNNVIE